MQRIYRFLLAITMAVVSVASFAAPVYRQVSVDLAQTNLVITASPNAGFNLWTTSFNVTNNTGAALDNVTLWYLAAVLDGQAPQWNDALHQFELADVLLRGYDHDRVIELGLSDIVPIAGFGVDAGDSVLVWDIGFVGVGETASISITREVSAAVQVLNSGIAFAVNDVPEPGSLALLGLGLAGLAVVRRRKQG